MSHLVTTRNPMGEARRQQVFGPLVPMALNEPDMPRWAWLLMGFVIALVVGLAVVS